MIEIRKYWRAGLAAPAALAMTLLGLTAPAQAQPGSPAHTAATTTTTAATTTAEATTKSLRSLDHQRPPAGNGRWIVSDPVAYRQAVKSGDWVYTPNGLSYKTCVYRAPNHAVVSNNKIVAPSGAVRRITPCMHPMLQYPAGSQALGHGGSEPTTAAPTTAAPTTVAPTTVAPTTVAPTTERAANGKVAPDAGPCYFGKGGDYWAGSCYSSSPAWVTSFDQQYAVPSNAAKSGALIFLWGGLENSAGNTLLQDVLTWGANGSIVTNPNVWYVTPWYLWPSNNSVIGPSIHVEPVDTIVADLTASKCSSGGHCTWLLKSTDDNNGKTTTLTVGSGVAFNLLFGSIMEVPRGQGCVETPTNGHAAFRRLTVKGNTGTISPDFGTSLPDPQCSISIHQTSTASDILWKP